MQMTSIEGVSEPLDGDFRVELEKFTGAGLDRGKPKWFEICWWLAKLLLIQTRFPWPSQLRRTVLRFFGAKIGKGFYIRPSVNIHFPWKLTIEDNVWIGDGCTILNLENVTIRHDTALAHEVYVSTGNHDISKRDFPYANAPIEIGPYAWLGTRSFIGSGCRIGEGSVVAAGAVVVRDVNRWTVVAGVPAKFLTHRKLDH